MFQLFTRSLLTVFILGSIFIFSIQPAEAVDDGSGWEISTGYDYFHIREDLPAVFKDHKLVNLALDYTMGNDNGQFSFGLAAKDDGAQLQTDLKELLWSGRVDKLLYEIGKTKWVWGRGLSFSPICPLDMDTYYWGGQGSFINNNRSLTIGAAWDKDPYNSDTSDMPLSTGHVSTNEYTGWFRSGWVFETSDLTTAISYQSVLNHWNFGLDFSRDLQNGFEFHGGVNIQNSDSVTQYLLGGEYSGHYLYILEGYHQTDDILIFAFSNSAAMLGNWQWEFR
ncbi:MAG TPA: hypothetical protein DDW65_06915, partial [Firmicutes bacterium]|nr:hypothetical protein [Bacillota bacterium]